MIRPLSDPLSTKDLLLSLTRQSVLEALFLFHHTFNVSVLLEWIAVIFFLNLSIAEL